MKIRKTYLIGLLTTCMVCMNILFLAYASPYDQKGPIDLGSAHSINNMVNL